MKYFVMIALVCLEARQGETTLRVSWAEPAEIDPHRAATLAESRYVSALFEGLVTHEADGVTPAPGMAEKWRASDDGLVWSFTLREAKWSNGDPVVAQDFVASWRRALRPETGCVYRGLFRMFKNVGALLDAEEADDLLATYDELSKARQAEAGKRLALVGRRRHAEALRRRAIASDAVSRPDVEEKDLGFVAVDARTLRVTLERSTPAFIDTLSFMSFLPVPGKAIATYGASWVKPGRIVTNGSYLLESATPAELTLRRNGAYWDASAAAAPERVVVAFHTPEVALKRYREGRLDWVTQDRVPAGEKDLVRYDIWGTVFLQFNARKAPFDRRGVRRAFAQAIDRKEMALVPAGFKGYPATKGLAHDRAAAMETLLRETGFDLSTFPKVEILSSDAIMSAAEADRLAQILENGLGISVRVRTMKLPGYLDALAAGEFHAALGLWQGDTYDPAAFLEIWTKDHPRNSTCWSGEEFDSRIRAAAEERDGSKRLDLLARAESLLLAEAPVVPLRALGDGYLAKDRVGGLHPNPMSRFPLKHLRLIK